MDARALHRVDRLDRAGKVGLARGAQRLALDRAARAHRQRGDQAVAARLRLGQPLAGECDARSEEHTSELQSLMRISYAVFCLKKKKTQNTQTTQYVNNSHS